MTSSRRSFLKFAAATPIAAPLAVKSTADALMGTQGLRVGMSESIASTQMIKAGMGGQRSEADWLKEEARNLMQQRKRAIEDSNRSDDGNYVPSISSQVDSIRSFSPATRIRVARERIRQRELERQLSYFDRRLADIKAQLGLDWFDGFFAGGDA